MDQYVVRVAHDSHVGSVAGSIAMIVREHRRAEVRAIGAGAVNQAVKALALAGEFLLIDGIEVIVKISRKVVTIDGNEKTAMVFLVEPR